MARSEARTVVNPYGEPLPGQVAFMDFMQGCWEAVRTANGGAPNVYGTADRMYEQLHAPLSPVVPGAHFPDKETFINGVRRAMLQKSIFKNALFPGAVEAVKDMNDRGPLIIWTAGDVYGGKNSAGKYLPGSMEQFVRVLGSDVLIGAVNTGHDLNVSGAEDKFKYLVSCFDWLIERGADEIVVLEDKLGNLQQVQQVATPNGLVTSGFSGLSAYHSIWVRQGKHGATNDEAPEGVFSLSSISELSTFIDDLQLERPGFLVDFDGVLSDDDRRRHLQQQSVCEYICQRGWVTQGVTLDESAT